MKAINLQNTIYLLGENIMLCYNNWSFLYLSGGETQAGSTVKAIIKYESDKETWEIENIEMLEKRKMHAVGIITKTKDICKNSNN